MPTIQPPSLPGPWELRIVLQLLFNVARGGMRMMKARDIPAGLGSEDICKIGR